MTRRVSLGIPGGIVKAKPEETAEKDSEKISRQIPSKKLKEE